MAQSPTNRQEEAPASLKAPPKPRLSPKLRNAITSLVEEGTTQRDAAQRAGMNEKSLSRALKKPHVAAHVDHLRALFSLEMDKLRGQAEAIAIRTGMDLMRNSKSDSVKARMVEFFARRDEKTPSVVINNNVTSKGYAFIPPGSRVVDITPPDGASQAQEPKAPMIEGE